MFDAINCPKPDEYGFFCHPDIPTDISDVAPWLTEHGFDYVTVDMDWDNTELSDQYHEQEDTTAVLRWVPTPPSSIGWRLVSVFDTEDGPKALFLRETIVPMDTSVTCSEASGASNLPTEPLTKDPAEKGSAAFCTASAEE